MIHLKVNEAVSVSKYKEWSAHASRNFYLILGEYFKKFKHHDKNYNRIYFDLTINPDNWKIEIPQEIEDFMGWYHYPILDYNKGICRDKDGREIRIGRLFNRLGREDLLKSYNNSKQNTLKNVDDLKVVISRHPYDIIGMSTGRGWSTCLDLDDSRYNKEHLGGLRGMLSRGCMVAYLIRGNDMNIKNPISRVVIRSYTMGSSINLIVDQHVYGTNVIEFTDFLDKWVKDYNRTDS